MISPSDRIFPEFDPSVCVTRWYVKPFLLFVKTHATSYQTADEYAVVYYKRLWGSVYVVGEYYWSNPVDCLSFRATGESGFS